MYRGSIGLILIFFFVVIVLLIVLVVLLIFDQFNAPADDTTSPKVTQTGENKNVEPPSPGYSQEELIRGQHLCPADKTVSNETQDINGAIGNTEPLRDESVTSVPKIVINNQSQYEPVRLDESFQFLKKTPNPRNDDRRYLLLEKQAYKKIKDSLDWGMITKRNRVEQGGVLLGKATQFENEIYCFVENILLANTNGDSVFVEFTKEMWADMQQGLAQLNFTLKKEQQLVIVGWFHTHPNGLSVFMSGTDMGTQRLNFAQDWQASLVMNPHTGESRVFFGARATEGKIVFPESQDQGKK